MDVPTSRRHLFRALRHRNYRLFFIGNGVSLIGNWITQVAMAWLVYRLAGANRTQAAALLGLVGFASQIPMFVFAPFTGVFIDRWNRRSILVITSICAALQSAALAYLALRGTVTIPHVLVLAVVQGVINAFEIPARQSFVIEMVDERSDLLNAIALNSMVFNSARLIGPAIAGFLIATVGEGLCFLIDSISYVGVIISLLLMRLAPVQRRATETHVLADLAEGFRYAFGFAPTRVLIGFIAVASLMGISYSVLLPIFADTFAAPGRGPQTLGFLSAAVGIGALCGGVFLASRHSVSGLGKVIATTGGLFGALLIAFSLAPSLAVALPLLAGCGFCFMVTLASSNTVLQAIADDDKRGRLMSIFSMAVMGTAPFGALLAGTIASRTSAPLALRVSGGVCIVAAAWFATRLPALRPLVRPIYVRKGIIKEVAAALETTPYVNRPAS
jgi:MFS family permease